MTEQNIQKKIISYLQKEAGAYVVKTVVSNRAGVPDLLACIGGRFVAIEVKRPGKDATPLQRYNIGAILEAGGTAFVAHGVDEVKCELKKAGLI